MMMGGGETYAIWFSDILWAIRAIFLKFNIYEEGPEKVPSGIILEMETIINGKFKHSDIANTTKKVNQKGNR